MKSIPLVNLSKQYKYLKRDLERAMRSVLENSSFILGPQVEEFEKSFAAYCGVKHCIGVASGTDALLLALRALGVGSSDEVITQANTFIATVLPVIYLGAKPIFVDCSEKNYQINVSALEKAITRKTKVIIPVHLYGFPAPMADIIRIARKHKVFVLEDACQAHGSSINGKKCGSFGDIAAFSFYPGKNLGAAGDGGAIVTNNKKIADTLYMMRNVGQSEKYKHDIIGYNSRLDTIQAAVLSVKLKYLDGWNKKRRELVNLYTELLSDLPLVAPPQWSSDFSGNYHLYVIRLKKRNELLAYLKNKGIFCGIHYPIPVYLQKCLKLLQYGSASFPVTEQYSKELLSLPMYPELTQKEVKYISTAIKKFFEQK